MFHGLLPDLASHIFSVGGHSATPKQQPVSSQPSQSRVSLPQIGKKKTLDCDQEKRIGPHLQDAVGTAAIIRLHDQTSVQVHIKKIVDESHKGIKEFRVFLTHAPEPLGSIKLAVRQCACDGPSVTDKNYRKNGERKLYIGGFCSYRNNEFSGIGSALLQVAIEYGFHHKCKGRLFLNAAGSSHGFYFKKGLRAASDPIKAYRHLEIMNQCTPSDVSPGMSPDTENHTDHAIKTELIKAAEERRTPVTSHLPMIPMYLPQEAIDLWKAKIVQQPILHRTKAKHFIK